MVFYNTNPESRRRLQSFPYTEIEKSDLLKDLETEGNRAFYAEPTAEQAAANTMVRVWVDPIKLTANPLGELAQKIVLADYMSDPRKSK